MYFDPYTVALLRTTLDRAWASLPPSQQAIMSRSILAERILKAAAQGDRDPDRLRARAAKMTELPDGPAKSSHHSGNTWFLALTALGVVFGDIGTSPLHTFSVALNATGHSVPTRGDVLGVVWLTFWALLLMVSLKYVVFVLCADNDGEGGIPALLALVATDKIADRARISVLVMLSMTKIRAGSADAGISRWADQPHRAISSVH
jgi:hypothetical protein